MTDLTLGIFLKRESEKDCGFHLHVQALIWALATLGWNGLYRETFSERGNIFQA